MFVQTSHSNSIQRLAEAGAFDEMLDNETFLEGLREYFLFFQKMNTK